MMDTDSAQRTPLTRMGQACFRHGVCDFTEKKCILTHRWRLLMEPRQLCGLSRKLYTAEASDRFSSDMGIRHIAAAK